MNNNNITFIGTRGTVVAIDQNNGDELWRTQLPGSFYAPVTIFFEEGKVFCGSNGKVFILCSKSGRLIAKNDLVGQGFGVVTFTTKKTEVVKQSEQSQYPQLGFQQHPQLMSEKIGNQNQQQEQEQPPMYQPPQQMYQSIPVEQESLYFVQPQSQQSNLPLVSRLFPSLNVQNGVEHQRLLDHFDEDEEYARSLDIELNGNNRNNQRENQRNLYQNNDSYLSNEHNRLMNNPNRLMTLSDLNNSINNHVRRNKKNNNSLLVSQDFNIFHNNINMYRNNRIQVEISIDDIIFVALNSFITAISKNNAQEVWRTQVPTSYGLPLSIMFTQGKLNIASGGHVYCLNAYTGKELWRKTLPGLGYTNVSIVSNSSQNSNFLSRLHH